MTNTYELSACNVRVLDAMIELLSDENRWTHSAYARDKHGLSVDEHSEDAVQWCARGAQYKFQMEFDCFGDLRTPMDAWLVQHGKPHSIMTVNDDEGYAAVMEALRGFRADVTVVEDAPENAS